MLNLLQLLGYLLQESESTPIALPRFDWATLARAKRIPLWFQRCLAEKLDSRQISKICMEKMPMNLIQTTLAIDLKSPEPRIAWNWMELGVASLQEIGKDMEGHLTIALCLKNSGFLTSSEISSINITKSCRVFQQSFA